VTFLSQGLGYLSGALGVLIALVLVGLGIGWVRPANPTAGWAIAAAGLIRAAAVAGTQVAWALLGFLEAHAVLQWLMIAVTTAEHVLFWGLLAFAAVSVARSRPEAP
jgi:hypothetical protein